jgi:hypothetical protein
VRNGVHGTIDAIAEPVGFVVKREILAGSERAVPFRVVGRMVVESELVNKSPAVARASRGVRSRPGVYSQALSVPGLNWPRHTEVKE